MAYQSSVTGCINWCDSDSAFWKVFTGSSPCTANGDVLQRWDDQSGSANHWTVLGAGNAIFRLTGINGLPGGRGDGTASCLQNDGLAGTWGDNTWFIVFKPPASPVAFETLLDKNYAPNGFSIGRDYRGGTLWGAYDCEPAPFIISKTLDETQPHIICSHRVGDVHTLFIDGETGPVVGATNASAVSAANDLRLFNSVPSADRPSAADIAATVGYLRALSQAERAVIWSYLGTHYNITITGISTLAVGPPVISNLAYSSLTLTSPDATGGAP